MDPMKTAKQRLAIKAHVKHYLPDIDTEQLVILEDHVNTHEYFLKERIPFEFTWDEALFSWYETVFVPLVAVLDKPILRWFFSSRQLSKGALYMQASFYWWLESTNHGSEVEPSRAVQQLVKAYPARTAWDVVVGKIVGALIA